jgi:hypothetical protein
MRLLLLSLIGLALSALTYLFLERLGRRALLAMALRTVTWTVLLVLIADLSCPARPVAAGRPLVLLDRSLSLLAAGGRAAEARDSAAGRGDVIGFGDERPGSDTAARGRSTLAPALVAALATSRPVTVVTDGEIEDASDIPADLLRQADMVVLPRAAGTDAALSEVIGPAHITAGDTVALEFEARATAGFRSDSLRIEVREGARILVRRPFALAAGAAMRGTIRVPTAGLGAGEHLLTVTLAATGDAETRDDGRLHLLSIDATPGVVLVASPPDFDSRTLYRTLIDVARLPVKGFVRLESGRWRNIVTLRPVDAAEVRQAATRADLLIAKGAVNDVIEGARARGLLRWPSGEDGESLSDGDWYLSGSAGGPLAGALFGFPLDSFPPATRLAALAPSEMEWTALTAQLGRRGAERPAVTGHENGRRREVVVGVDGLWRWAFRGGSSEAAYRALVGASISWLLGGADSGHSAARPARAVVEQGRPLTFERLGPAGGAMAISLDGASIIRDSLRFDGAGQARLYLPPGRYRYRLAAGGEGTVAVEQYSSEWWPRQADLTSHVGQRPVPTDQGSARRLVWLFFLCVAALAGEWFVRRRLGLR